VLITPSVYNSFLTHQTAPFTRVPTGQGKLEKVREFEWSGKCQGKIFFGKVRENEKLVPPDVRFSG